MNENVKKILLGSIAAVLLIVAVYEGVGFAKGPSVHAAYTIGHGTPGQGMKAAEKAEAAAGAAGAAGAPGAGAAGGDPLAGPNPGK